MAQMGLQRGWGLEFSLFFKKMVGEGKVIFPPKKEEVDKIVDRE